MELSEEAINRLIKLGRESAGPQTVAGGNIPYVIDGNGEPKPMASLIYNDHTVRPERVKAQVTVYDTESFHGYWTDYADEDSRAFADEPSLSITGVLDYHQRFDGGIAGSPRWCQHRVTLALRASDQWSVWITHANKQMNQQAFGEFLEQNSMDITAPSPGAMTDIARDLVATTECDFSAGYRPQDGQVKLRYTETVNAKVGAGTLAVPEHFTITIPIFAGGTDINLPALFRFRVKEQRLVVWYTLVGPEIVRRDAFLAVRGAIEAALQIKLLNGKAPA